MKKTYIQPATEVTKVDSSISLLSGSERPTIRTQTNGADPGNKDVPYTVYTVTESSDPFGGRGQGEGGMTTRSKYNPWSAWDD